MLRFIAARAAPGVECVIGETYHRTVGIGPHRGWLSVSPIAGRHELSVQLATSLAPILPAILARLQNLFDLDARPDIIAGHLRTDRLLADLVTANPGLRVQGAFDSTELAVRAILGQQVSVRAASTLAGRVAERFGEPIETPIPGLNRITPTAATLAAATSNDLAAVGMPRVRAESVRTLARLIAGGELDLEPGADPAATVAQLVELPGIGPWTAEYIAMRALRWPDAFPAADLGLAKALQLSSTKAVQAASEAWRPWRAYAAMHLWQSLATSATPIAPKLKTATR
jgi:AraC family transcriptional regulator of adaptative response / DNA-3-methyladenine glycosylase II